MQNLHIRFCLICLAHVALHNINIVMKNILPLAAAGLAAAIIVISIFAITDPNYQRIVGESLINNPVNVW